MFEMINEEKPSPERRKLFLIKVVIFIVAMVIMAGVIYFLATSGT
jgi:flagellar basal body-associated protein FliL